MKGKTPKKNKKPVPTSVFNLRSNTLALSNGILPMNIDVVTILIAQGKYTEAQESINLLRKRIKNLISNVTQLQAVSTA